MTIEQTIEIPADRRIFLDLPLSIPAGVKARVEINIPAGAELSSNGLKQAKPAKSFRGILKGKGITLERFREMQREDTELENEIDARKTGGHRFPKE
jgi:hypothetical protein